LLGIEKGEHITTLIPIESDELAESKEEDNEKACSWPLKKGR
jgi:hypothetical protein